MRPLLPSVAALLVPAALLAQPTRFEVTYTPAASAGPVTGRLVVIVAKAAEPEPTIWVHLNDGTQERFTIASGTLYGDVQKVRVGGDPVRVTMTHVVPPASKPTDTDYTLGHSVPFDFSKAWRSADVPRVVAISLEQQTPYYPDSYPVNSANNGPYGEAIVEEVIPALEKQFRLVSAPWARHVEGASTGGWQTLALQLQHPDVFGGAWVLQPDPIDFVRQVGAAMKRDAPAGHPALEELP